MRYRYLLLIVFSLFTQSLYAQSETYYGDLFDRIDKFSPSQLQRELNKIVSSYHIKRKGLPDLIQETKPQNFKSSIHTPLNYNNAKEAIFNILDTKSRPENMVDVLSHLKKTL